MRYFLAVLSVAICMFSLMNAKEYQVTRKVEQKIYTINCDNRKYHISHFKATRTEKELANDVIHYIVAAINRPTIIIRHVFSDIDVVLNQTNICNMTGQSISFTDEEKNPEYSGIIISNIFPYIDSGDQVMLSNDVNEIFHNQENVLGFFDWNLATPAVKSSSDPSVTFNAMSTNGFFKGSSLSFQVDVRKSNGYQKSLPGYPMDANLTQFFIKMDNLPGKVKASNASSENLRYAVEVFCFSVNGKADSVNYKLVKSIDDEYSPGVFETWSVTLPQSQPSQLKPTQSFVSWKPVGYKDATPGYKNQALGHFSLYEEGLNKHLENHGKLSSFNKEELPWSISYNTVSKFFGVNVTLGSPKDEGYGKYMQWSGMVGSGKPPLDSHLSEFAITVITLGLGGPFVAGFLIAVFVWIIRRLWKSNSAAKSKYTPIS